MDSNTIILSMTTWPPRYTTTAEVMACYIQQRHKSGLDEKVHCVLVFSEEEACSTYSRQNACKLMAAMDEMGVEVIIDKGNIRSHKKLIPTLEKYPNNPILVVDDDVIQRDAWLSTYIEDHSIYPDTIIYGQSQSRISVKDGIIHEERSIMPSSKAGKESIDLKPASGAAGTLFPAHTFTDERFFDRELMMKVSPSSDETWQYAFAMIEHPKFRCLSRCNLTTFANANQDCALFKTNRNLYDKTHNDIARAVPDYLEALERLL